MITMTVLLWSLAHPPAAARPRDCVDFLLRQVRLFMGRGEAESPLFARRHDAYRAELQTDTASLKSAFEQIPVGNFKTRLAIREVEALGTTLDRIAGERDPDSRDSWRRIELKKRHAIYYCYLLQLYYDPAFRAAVLDLPDELIREGARTIFRAEASEAFARHHLILGWYPHVIDVEPILAEKAERATR